MGNRRKQNSKKNLHNISNKSDATLKTGSSLKLNMILMALFSVFTVIMILSGYFSIGLLSDDYLNVISANSSTLTQKFSADVPYYSKQHFRPLWFLSIQFTHAISSALGFSNDNFILFRIENLLLLYLLIFTASHVLFKITGRVNSSMLLSLMILLFPNNLNSICWTIGKVDLMACIFILGSIYFSARYSQDSSKVWLIISSVLLAFGLLTKETAVITPFVCYLILKHSDTREEGRRKTLLLYQSAIVVLYLVFRIFITSGSFTDTITAYSDSTLSGRLIVALQAFISLLFPFDYLSLQNDLAHLDFLLISYIVIIILLFLSLVHAVWKKNTSGLLLSSMLIFFISIIPNLVAGYFRPQLILIPFTLTSLSLLLFISKSEVNFRIPGAVLVVVIIYWLLIDYRLIENWRYASNKSEEAISALVNFPEDKFENAIFLGLPARINQAHMTEYSTGPYNYYRYGTVPVRSDIKDAVHVSALDAESLSSELKIERSGKNEYYVYANGATQYFQITGQRENTVTVSGVMITLDSLNNFHKPKRMKIETGNSTNDIFLYNTDQLVKLRD